ncbi:MAG: hypothetical protein ACOVNU_11040 [Candidatus Kapaibacteriota bacterium]|jgi:hypothetical protein
MIDLQKIYNEFINFKNEFELNNNRINFFLFKYFDKIEKKDQFDDKEIRFFKDFIFYYYTNYYYISYLTSKVLRTFIFAEKVYTKPQIKFITTLYLIINENKSYSNQMLIIQKFNFKDFVSTFIYVNNFGKEYFEIIKEIDIIELIAIKIGAFQRKINKICKSLEAETVNPNSKKIVFFKLIEYYSILYSIPSFIIIEIFGTIKGRYFDKMIYDNQYYQILNFIVENLILMNNNKFVYYRLNNFSKSAFEEISKFKLTEIEKKLDFLYSIRYSYDLSNLIAYQEKFIVKTKISHYFCFEILSNLILSKIQNENEYISIIDPFLSEGRIAILFADKINYLCKKNNIDPFSKYQIIASDVNFKNILSFEKKIKSNNFNKHNIGIEKNLQENKLDYVDKFEILIINAPNTKIGENVFYTNYKYMFRPEDIKDFRYKQTISFYNNLKFVKPGGYIIYLTDSINFSENIMFVNKILKDESLEPIPIFNFASDNIKKLKYHLYDEKLNYLTVLPSDFKSTGFFIALFKKK